MSIRSGAIGTFRKQALRLAAPAVIGVALLAAAPALTQPMQVADGNGALPRTAQAMTPQGSARQLEQPDIFALYSSRSFPRSCSDLDRQRITRVVEDAIANRKADENEQDMSGFEYTVRPILFWVAAKNAAEFEARKNEAEALRERFNNCDDGLALARTFRNVIVRDAIRKTSADLQRTLRKILDEMPVGRLTPPEFTRHGVEIFALCERNRTIIKSSLKRDKLIAEAVGRTCGSKQ